MKTLTLKHREHRAGSEGLIFAARLLKEISERTPSIVYTMCIYLYYREKRMDRAKVFQSGNSQAVRLPKEFRFKSSEVQIFRRGDEIVLREKSGDMSRAFDLLAGLPDDMGIDRGKDVPQKREGL